MWPIPHCIVTQKLNSYTLETLSGLPLAGVNSSRQLQIFKLWEGTKLALAELAHMETQDEERV
jgi:hypothetical protein